MIGYTRTKLRLIRYYSAPRRRTLLTRFIDIGLIAAIVLAMPAAWITNAEIVEEAALIARDGHLTRGDDGGVLARVLDPDLNLPPREDVPYGEFHLLLVERRQGWPVSSTVTQPRVVLDLNLYDQPGSRKDVTLDTDSPEHAAILTALERARLAEMSGSHTDAEATETLDANYTDLIARWRANETNIDYRIFGWIFNIGASWALLSLLLSLLAAAMWVISLIFIHNQMVKAHGRRSEGRCARCGYDLFGLDFNDRCPECGTIIH